MEKTTVEQTDQEARIARLEAQLFAKDELTQQREAIQEEIKEYQAKLNLLRAELQAKAAVVKDFLEKTKELEKALLLAQRDSGKAENQYRFCNEHINQLKHELEDLQASPDYESWPVVRSKAHARS